MRWSFQAGQRTWRQRGKGGGWCAWICADEAQEGPFPGRPIEAYLAADGVNLVDEDDAGRVGACLLEQISHARRPHAHKHLHKIAAGNGVKRHVRLARRGLGQQRLARAWGAAQQRPFGDFRAQVGEFLGVLEKFDEFRHLKNRNKQ